MLIGLLDLVLVLTHILILRIVLILRSARLMMILRLGGHFLHVLQHDLHVGLFPTALLLIQLFRDQGSIPLSSVRTFIS